jgi:thiol-disulfide isomerase/thioredoxin
LRADKLTYFIRNARNQKTAPFTSGGWHVGGRELQAFQDEVPLEGAQKSLSDVLGKATLVVFFFPTCPFCNVAFPEIQKLHDRYKDQGLSTVAINVIPQEERLIPEWLSTHGYTVPVLIGGRSVKNDYKLTMTPTHFLLDAQGHVISRHTGYKPGDGRELEREIQ